MTLRLWAVLGLLIALGLTVGCGASRTAEKPKDTKDYGGKVETAPTAPPLTAPN